ncbi:MAG: class I SAM-dependent methyltransferase [Proteobacteria bacterium]|nr:class I SAM-dependent methyltransferase [Pseudomonadota bacterium]
MMRSFAIKLGAVRVLLGILQKTPFHPQWFAFFREDIFLRNSCAELGGVVLDIGCADAKPRNYLPADATYIGIGYNSTATEWYGTRPNIFADAQVLPLRDGSVDHVLLLDVLEHLPDPQQCLAEIHRVLRPDGTCTLQVPFVYPIHDVPLDFHRWTTHGLQRAAAQHGFGIGTLQAVGQPAETAALNANIAMSKTVLNWINDWNPLALMIIVLAFVSLTINCVAWTAAILSRPDDMMPYAYRMTWFKA